MPGTGVRAQASQRVREAIIAATVRLVAREGVGAVTHRRVAAEADVALSSTTWHFATKTDILEAALAWAAEQEVARIAEIAEQLAGDDFDPDRWAGALADWLLAQVHEDRDVVVALYRLQIELLGSPEVHREWTGGLLALGEQALGEAAPATAELDIRLVIATLDGLRLSLLMEADDEAWVRPLVQRQLRALFA